MMFFESRASRQNSAHHDAECVPRHHDGPAQEEQRSFDGLQKKYSSSRCHLHKVDLRGAGSMQSAIEADERAGLLASTDNEIRIICVNLELLNDTNCIIKRNIKKTDRYLVILQQRLERFRQGNALPLEHSGERIVESAVRRTLTPHAPLRSSSRDSRTASTPG